MEEKKKTYAVGINHDFLVQFMRVQSLFPIFNNNKKKNTVVFCYKLFTTKLLFRVFDWNLCFLVKVLKWIIFFGTYSQTKKTIVFFNIKLILIL
jgi:hypothetical protein